MKEKTKKSPLPLVALILVLAAAVCMCLALSGAMGEKEPAMTAEEAMDQFLTAMYSTEDTGVEMSRFEEFVSQELLAKMIKDDHIGEDTVTVESVEFSDEVNGVYQFDVEVLRSGEPETITGEITFDPESGMIVAYQEDEPEVVVEEVVEPEPEPVVLDAEGIYVCVDAGHGGIDPGTHNPAEENHNEKDDNLALALAVRDKLEERGAKVLLTRDDDTFYKPSERCSMANNAGVNYFLCIHRNYAEGDAHGIEIWVSSHASEESVMLGEKLEEHLIEAGVSKSRGVQNGSQSGSGDYMVLRDTTMPGLLAEMGFMGNEEDNRLFKENLDAYASAYADAVVDTWQAYHEKK